MRLGGWIFLVLSTGFVVGLAAWCYYKVLTLPDDGVVKPPDMLGG